jgi:4-amino-4-deoxy-L-arabinose transferase-like glycosyltransferase
MRVKHTVLGFLAGSITFALLLATVRSIGVAWDEPIYNEATERAARWFGLLLRGDFAGAVNPYTFGVSWGLVNEHPPLMRLVNGLGWTLTQGWLGAPLIHRFGSLLLAALTVGAVVGMTAYWRGPRAALFAGAALLAMPRLFFHMHLSVLDFPLAAIWILGTLIFYGEMRKIRLHMPTPAWRPSPASAFVVGSWIGLGLLTKINAVLLLPFWGIWLLCYRRTLRHLLTFGLGLPIGLLVLIAGWPWIWKDPINGLWNWVQFFRVHFEIRQWFAGQLYVDTPWTLPFVIVGITTPLLILVIAVLGVTRGSRVQVKRARWDLRKLVEDEWTGLHLLGMVTVLGYYALPFTPIHDQDRLLLAAFVHLAILAGDGFERLTYWIFTRTARPSQRSAQIAIQIGLGLLLLLPGIVQSVRLHPYQLAYYNETVGGVTGARRLDLETIYFATTYGHFLPALNRLPPDTVLWVMPNSWDVLYYYQNYGLLRTDLVILRPPGWGSFYDDQGVPWQEGNLDNADYALIERRQTTFNAVIPEYAPQLAWATYPELARLTRNGVVLATLHSRP